MPYHVTDKRGTRFYIPYPETPARTDAVLAALRALDMAEYYRLQHGFLSEALQAGRVDPVCRARAFQTLAHLERLARVALLQEL